MKKNIFSLSLVRDFRYDVQFFRSHLVFISSLFSFISEKKMFFLKNPSLLRNYFKGELLQYLKFDKSILVNRLFLNIIAAVDKVYYESSRELFSHIYTLLLAFLEKGYYTVSFLYLPSLLGITEDKLNQIYALFNKRYQINAKLCVVLLNKNLEKGCLIKYKNYLIDISIRKLIYELKNIIDVEKIGELVNAQ